VLRAAPPPPTPQPPIPNPQSPIFLYLIFKLKNSISSNK
jgi:hypothetical protein